MLACAINLKPEEREFVVDPGASMHMISKKDLISSELETVTTSRSPTTVKTANGEVKMHEEATVYRRRIGYILDHESPRGYEIIFDHFLSFSVIFFHCFHVVSFPFSFSSCFFFLFLLVEGSKSDFSWASISLRFLLAFLIKKIIFSARLGRGGEGGGEVFKKPFEAFFRLFSFLFHLFFLFSFSFFLGSCSSFLSFSFAFFFLFFNVFIFFSIFFSFSFHFLCLCCVLKKSDFFLGLNFVAISLDSSYVKNQFLGSSRVVGTPLGPLFLFFLLFSPVFCLFSCFLIFHFFSFFVHFVFF